MRGLLLVNLGTPDAPTTEAVRRFLRAMLSDPKVMDMPAWGRWLLLNAVILPFRPARSAHAYRQVWTERGSPLLAHSFDLVSELARASDDQVLVQVGMRYGNPSMATALEALRAKGVDELVVFPLYPQEADSTTGTVRAWLDAHLAAHWPQVKVRYVPPFFREEGFLDAFVQVARPVLAAAKPEHVLFSFHGLPKKHLRRVSPACRADDECCAALGEANAHCYRAQALHTARQLASRLALAEGGWTATFQSRLGGGWIGPFTDATVDALAARGVKRLAVMCPAFVADCLETLEEIGLRAREQFRQQGGEELVLVPSLNAHPAWVRAVLELAGRASPA